MGGLTKIPVGYVLAPMIVVPLVHAWLTRKPEVPIDYSDFKTLLRAGEIYELRISESSISGTADLTSASVTLPETARLALKRSGGSGPVPFRTARVEDPRLVEDLDSADVRYKGATDQNWLTMLIS